MKTRQHFSQCHPRAKAGTGNEFENEVHNFNMADFPFQSVCSALVAISMAISLMVFLKQPTPYLDEVFHIPQAQEFCKHEFSRWDPKITTLPGLYFSSLAILEPLAVVLKQNLVVICSPFWLRITNVLFLLGIVVFLRLLLLKLHVDDKGRSTETKVRLNNVTI